MRFWRIRRSRVRLDGVVVNLPDLDVSAGERIAVLGPNGAGKSTLLRALAGLVDVEGEVETNADPRDVAWVAQRPFLMRGSVVENVALALTERGVAAADRRRRSLAALERFGVADLAERPSSALSEGQRQRVAFARAVVVKPKALLLDEPLGPLDADGARRVADALREDVALAVVVASPTVAGLPAIEFSRTITLR